MFLTGLAIGFGAVFGGVIAIQIALMYRAVIARHASERADVPPLRVPAWLVWVSIAVLAAGAAYEVAVTALGFAA